jgi:hypothetical protein
VQEEACNGKCSYVTKCIVNFVIVSHVYVMQCDIMKRGCNVRKLCKKKPRVHDVQEEACYDK